MKENILRFILALTLVMLFSCASTGDKSGAGKTAPGSALQASPIEGTVFGSAREFVGSPYEEVGRSGLFGVHRAATCRIAVLPNGDDSFTARIQALKKADTSVRIQALIFTGDESGLYITELLKEKKAQGLDVRVIVDAMSNPGVQTQWMYFDLKQHGVEVEGYETFYLQWLNELPLAWHDAADKTTSPNKRYHEKMWIIDGETDHGVAVVGGLNDANEYFRIDPQDPSLYWRDQDVIVKGDVVKDMVAAFERNFEYFLKVKESRGIFNTNIYWEETRKLLDKTTKVQMNHITDERLNQNVRKLADKKLELKAVFDRLISIVGSYNLDPRSRSLNSESAIVFEDKKLSTQLADMFYRNDLDFSRQITLEDTKAFNESGDALYQLQKEFGILIEDTL